MPRTVKVLLKDIFNHHDGTPSIRCKIHQISSEPEASAPETSSSSSSSSCNSCNYSLAQIEKSIKITYEKTEHALRQLRTERAAGGDACHRSEAKERPCPTTLAAQLD